MIIKGDFYRLIPTSFGDIGMVWREEAGRILLCRVFLPVGDRAEMEEQIRNAFPHVSIGHSSKTDQLAHALQKAMKGEPETIQMKELDMAPCTKFQLKVLDHCSRIPRGRVSSYLMLADTAGAPQGARAAGMVMANNPFPLIIPCHRVVRSDGSLGGFGGGLAMKRALLVSEGVVFDDRGRVRPDYLIK